MTTFQGRLYWHGDEGYEQERVGRVFNGRKPDRYPAAILKVMTQSTYVYPKELFDEVMPWLHEVHPTLAPTVEIFAIGITVPFPPEVEHAGGPVLVVHGVVLADTREEAVEALAPLETCPLVGKALVRQVAIPTSLAVKYQEQHRANPEGHRYAVDNIWTNAAADEVVPALRDAFTTLPTEQSFSLWFGMARSDHCPTWLYLYRLSSISRRM